jgi:hypothetical protein
MHHMSEEQGAPRTLLTRVSRPAADLPGDQVGLVPDTHHDVVINTFRRVRATPPPCWVLYSIKSS